MLEKVKARKNVSILQENVEEYSYNGQWNAKIKHGGSISAKYLVYGDYESIYRSILDGTPKIP